MSKPILKNCPHCGGEISFRVFADLRRKHSKYVLSVKCNECKTVTTICTKERGGAAFAALAEKWNARKAHEKSGFQKALEKAVSEIDINGNRLKPCTNCGRFPAGFSIRQTEADGYTKLSAAVICDCGAESASYIESWCGGILLDNIDRAKNNAAALWNVRGAIK